MVTIAYNFILKNFDELTGFVVVGIINTAVDFAVLNTLLALFYTSASTTLFGSFKAAAFLVSVVVSYLLNKHFVFRANRGKVLEGKEAGKFMLINLLNLALNTAVAVVCFELFSAVLQSSSIYVVGNISVALASGVTAVSSYLGYKFIVFKHHD